VQAGLLSLASGTAISLDFKTSLIENKLLLRSNNNNSMLLMVLTTHQSDLMLEVTVPMLRERTIKGCKIYCQNGCIRHFIFILTGGTSDEQ
jgi:hypothetical protein